MSILVAGSANLDFVVRATHIPAPGETVLGRDFQTFPGGKGANQAVACARAGGAATQMLLSLGSDAFAAPLEASLKNAGVRMHISRSATLPTGTAFICVSDDAQNAITVAPGANQALHAADLPSLAGVSHLLLQLETPLETVTAYAQAARRAGVRVVLNAAPAHALPPTLLEALDVLVVNEGELGEVTGVSDDIDAALARLAVPTVIVTLGERGCCARHLGQRLQLPAFAVEPVDTTAAGDTFCGVLAAGLSQGDALIDALHRASAAAAIVCTRPGAQASIPTQEEVAAFLSAHKR
ncbi:MAG: ribokinase [Pseudomonadota bacterium]